MSEKKESVKNADEVVEGAKKEIKKRHEGHTHPLMQVKLNLLEVSHRHIEEIEKSRFRIMNNFDGMESIEKFKDLVFEKLTGLTREELERLCE